MSAEPVPAHPAATVLLLRDGLHALEVFMVVRHQQIAFMGGALVFPGGRVDASDVQLAQAYGSSSLPSDSLPLRIAAIRETFEEAGILLARPIGSDRLITGDQVAAWGSVQEAVHADAREFPAFLERERLTLALDALVPYAHWITPVVRPKRFDTHFFAVVAPADQMPRHDGHEAVELRWIAPHEAMADAAAGRCRLEFPTRANLQPLLAPHTVAEAMALIRSRPVVTVLPVIDADGARAALPPEAGYGAEPLPLDG